MKERPDDRPDPLVEDAEFVRRLAEHYAPPPLDAQRRAGLDTALRDRIGEGRGFGLVRPVFATAAVGLALAVALTWDTNEPAAPGGASRVAVFAGAESNDTWERDLFDPETYESGDSLGDVEELPDDYAAIAGIFLDG